MRLRETLLGKVRQRVELLQPRAVTEMETRDRIKRPAIAAARAQEVRRGGVQQRLLQALGGAVLPPIGLVEVLQRREVFRQQDRIVAGALAREPIGKARNRRERHEIREPRKLARNLLYHLLDQEAAEADPAQTALAVRDRIEYRGVRVFRRERIAVFAEDRRDGARDAVGERHLDEDQ